MHQRILGYKTNEMHHECYELGFKSGNCGGNILCKPIGGFTVSDTSVARCGRGVPIPTVKSFIHIT